MLLVQCSSYPCSLYISLQASITEEPMFEPYTSSHATSITALQQAMSSFFLLCQPILLGRLLSFLLVKIPLVANGFTRSYIRSIVLLNNSKLNQLCGDTQVEGVNFYETFSPVVKMTTIKSMVLSLSENSLFQLDANNNLNGQLDEEFYVKLPLSYFFLSLLLILLSSARSKSLYMGFAKPLENGIQSYPKHFLVGVTLIP